MEKRSRGKSNQSKKEVRDFEQKTIDVARVARVMEGGRRFSFRATVVIGNRKGKVGVGVSKALSVANAVEKAYADAKKNVIEFPLEGRTIPHDISSKIGASKILLMPAKEGRGLVAGGTVRVVLELAGIKDITSKALGSSNKINNARATAKALKKLTESMPISSKKENETEKLETKETVEDKEISGLVDLEDGKDTEEIRAEDDEESEK